MAFDTFFGNEALKSNISVMIANHQLPHSIILQGENGLGKKTFANLIAAALLCENGSEKPCLNCSVCRNVLSGHHPDVAFYEPNKKTPNNFSVDLVREIKNNAFIMPNQSKYKIYILNKADCMNLNAQNAILKILEEPPSYAVFILLAENKSTFIETILSRAVVFTLERVKDEEAKKCVAEKIKGPTKEEISCAVDSIGGNIGKVIECLKGESVAQATEKALEIGRAIVDDKEYTLLSVLSEFEGNKQMLLSVIEPLSMLLRDALAYRCSGKILINKNRDTAILIAQKLTKQQIFDVMNVCAELEKKLNRNANNKLLLTWLCSCLRSATEF